LTVDLTGTFLRITCDRERCTNVIVHIPFLTEDDSDDISKAHILEHWPYTDPEAKKRLCAVCLAGARDGKIEVRWKR
jgi:hypothetical protein